MPTVHNIPNVGTVHFPDTMTEEQVAEAIAQMPEAQKNRDSISDKLYANSELRWTERPNAMVKVGRGAQDVVDRLSQLQVAAGEKMGYYPEGLGEQLTANLNQEQADYEQSRGPDAGRVDPARLVGNVAIQAPLALASRGSSLPATIGSGVVTGAASGALQYDPKYSFKNSLRNIGVGGAVGGVASPIARLVGTASTAFVQKGLGRFKGLMERTKGTADPTQIIREVPEFAALKSEMRANLIIEAQEQIKKTGSLNVEELARKANLIRNDVTPTKSMVTRNPRDWTMERNMQKLAQSPDEQIAKMGQELTDTYVGNDKALVARLQSLSEKLPKGTQEAHGMAVMKSLDDLSKASQKRVGQLYELVKKEQGDQLASDARQLADTLDNLKDSTYAEKLVGSVNNKLKRFGMIDNEGKLTNKTLTVSQAEELRKFVNTLPNDFGKKDIIKAIDEDVLSGAGSDAFGTAREAAKKRFGMLDNPSTQRALGAWGELQQGKTAQNFIKTNLIDAADQDVLTLVRTLNKLPKARAAKARDELGAGLLKYLESKSVNPNSGQFSGAGLNKAVKDIGEGKIEAVLGKQGLDEIKSLARAGLDATYQPPYSAVNSSNTAPFLLAMTQRARTIPGVPLLVNENLEKAAARVGYGSQLKQVMAAKSRDALPQFNYRLGMIRGGAPAAANAVLDQERKKANAAGKQAE